MAPPPKLIPPPHVGRRIPKRAPTIERVPVLVVYATIVLAREYSRLHRLLFLEFQLS